MNMMKVRFYERKCTEINCTLIQESGLIGKWYIDEMENVARVTDKRELEGPKPYNLRFKQRETKYICGYLIKILCVQDATRSIFNICTWCWQCYFSYIGGNIYAQKKG